jgi:hypothetical protein
MYGGRGIKVCDRWKDFSAFLTDMGERPAGLSIDRIDSDGHYEPENCRWASSFEQAVNQRHTRLIEHGGMELAAAQWAKITGVPSYVIRARIDKLGWPVARALYEPIVPAAVSIARASSKQPTAPIDEYVAALQRGESCASIAKRYGVTSSGVRKALQRRGIAAGEFTQSTEARRARGLALQKRA